MWLLPGLCDAHVHCTAVTADLAKLMSYPGEGVAGATGRNQMATGCNCVVPCSCPNPRGTCNSIELPSALGLRRVARDRGGSRGAGRHAAARLHDGARRGRRRLGPGAGGGRRSRPRAARPVHGWVRCFLITNDRGFAGGPGANERVKWMGGWLAMPPAASCGLARAALRRLQRDTRPTQRLQTLRPRFKRDLKTKPPTRPRAQPDGRPRGLSGQGRGLLRVRHRAPRHRPRLRRRRRVPPRGAGRAAARGALHQGHGLRRRGVADGQVMRGRSAAGRPAAASGCLVLPGGSALP